MNKIATFIGKYSSKYRKRWLRRNKTWLWGISLFMKDFPPPPEDRSIKIDMGDVQDIVLDKAIYRDPFDNIRDVQRLMKEYPNGNDTNKII